MKFDFPLFPEQASTIAGEVDNLYFFALAVSAFFSLLIAVFIFIFFVKYRRRSTDEVGKPVHGAMVLEVVWSIIPLAISMVMFGWGAKVFIDSYTVPEGATEYFATGKQWMWKFQHPEGHREINTLHVPVGELIKITMTSEDVIHSFFVPAFRVKRDVLPGRYTNVWFEATRPGEYHLFCAEYCGTDHAKMGGTVVVLAPDDYQAWLSGATPGATPAAAGAELFEQFACNTCHEEQGTGRGPTLHGIAGQEVTLAGGRRVERDDAYLRESILNPSAKMVEGHQPLMPTFQGQINEEGVLQLIAYIKTLDGSVDGSHSAETNTAPTED